MNWYLIGAIVAVLILGLFIIYASESEQEYNRGYDAAVDAYRRQMQAAMWQQYFNQAEGESDEDEKNG